MLHHWWAYVAFLFVARELSEAGCPELTPIVTAGKVGKVVTWREHKRTLQNTDQRTPENTREHKETQGNTKESGVNSNCHCRQSWKVVTERKLENLERTPVRGNTQENTRKHYIERKREHKRVHS